MRLQSLKLAGFKSFVDPVTFRFPDPLTAIVGPNGCGKSNVIDAIRWVMGESSARQLRGDAMSDVIFAGTSQRKPVGQASVELVFENTMGKLGGAYNHYTELAVRRQVTRDGRSDYFLNGQRCRRRDITDIFLGTGLGARSYAVIQQGMINRLVEAKPDDLRVFIEEAAGVSRYQSRRRETAQHLEHTRLNLSRLHDVAEELASQMRSLKRQSQAAERYRSLQAEQQQLQVEIYTLRDQQVRQQQSGYTEQLSRWGEQFRQLKTTQQQTEQQEQQQTDALTSLLAQAEPDQQHWQWAEQQLAQASTELAQLTQQQQQQTQQHQSLEHQKRVLTAQLRLDQTDLQQLQQHQQQTIHALQQLPDPEQQRVALQVAEQAWHRWQVEEQQQQQQLAQRRQQLTQAQQQQHALEKQQQRANQQIQQLEHQHQQLIALQPAQHLSDLQQQLNEMNALRQQWVEQQQHTVQKIEHTQQQMHAVQHQHQMAQQQLAAEQAEQMALQQMQVALGVTASVSPDTQSSTLLAQFELTAQGQQYAIYLEAMLARWLMAQVESSTNPALIAGQAYYRHMERHTLTALEDFAVQPLQTWLLSPQLSLWAGVGIVTDHATALRLRDGLQAGQSLLTHSGEWVGLDWQLSLQPVVESDRHAAQGALTCQLRLTALQDSIVDHQQQIADQQQQQLKYQTQLSTLQQQQREQTVQQKNQQQTQHQLALECVSLESRLHSQAQQQVQISQQLQGWLEAQADDQAELNELYLEIASLDAKIQPLQQTLSYLQQQREPLATQHQQQLVAQQQREQQRQELWLEQQTQHSRITLLVTQIERQQQQMVQLEPSLQATVDELTRIEQHLPAATLQHDQALSIAESARQTWQQRQARLQAIQALQQQLLQQRQQQQQAEYTLRDDMEQARVAWQGCKAELEYVAEQFRQLNRQPLDDVSGAIAPREQQLITITTQLARLGELNLAAPAALTEISERHAELTHQMQDLQHTVQQLEQAMQQIDGETRSLFMQTFDQVNSELQVLFPKVFGGGEAYLSLEDDWQSGVRLMARPPGKKNSNISLLSGGEKALTALALVFAIFRLNPAPFCLLDEVDAPLDDANVTRFCHLVQELSAQVQFIFISHNKLAMSMASQLLGVTMPEAGVSRLVAVNLEQAAAFAPL